MRWFQRKTLKPDLARLLTALGLLPLEAYHPNCMQVWMQAGLVHCLEP